MLVEVMVGTIVLAIATAAVLDGLDGAQKTGSRNKQRSVASTLAQQDLERLRSMPITALNNLAQTRQVDVTGVQYTVNSDTTWMRDKTIELSCTDDTAQAEYLKVSSTVTSPAATTHPVVEHTLLTPAPGAFSSTSGTAAIRATDRLGKPLANVTVDLGGPSSQSGTTNDLGCVIFDYIPAGDYVATIPGNLVSWNSAKPASAPVTVNPGKISQVQIELEQPASMRILFKNPSGTSVNWTKASVPHANLPGGFKVFTSATPTSLIDATDLFPQLGGYDVYAGDCEFNNPANQWWGDGTYFDTHPASHVDLDPGDSFVNVTATLPVLTINVTRQRRQDVWLQIDQNDTATGVTCQDTMRERTLGGIWIAKSSSSSTTVETVSNSIALPFGTYRLCVDDNATSSSGTVRRRSSGGSVSDPQLYTAGTVSKTFDLTTGGTAAQCQDPF
jgi:type II secretory pathway pseudopilin PulG